MPGLDQTGPVGQGPMTGWRMGRCTRFGERWKQKSDAPAGEVTQTDEPVFQGRGRQFGRRGWGGSPGMGRRNRFRGGWDE